MGRGKAKRNCGRGEMAKLEDEELKMVELKPGEWGFPSFPFPSLPSEARRGAAGETGPGHWSYAQFFVSPVSHSLSHLPISWPWRRRGRRLGIHSWIRNRIIS